VAVDEGSGAKVIEHSSRMLPGQPHRQTTWPGAIMAEGFPSGDPYLRRASDRLRGGSDPSAVLVGMLREAER